MRILFLLIFLFSYTELEAKPARIVSINLCADELVLRLADPKNIAAVSFLSEDPNLSSVVDLSAKVPKTFGSPEEVLLLNPDVVIAGSYTTPETTVLLKRLGYKVYQLGLPTGFEELFAQIDKLSKVIGEEARGQAMVAQMQDQLLELRSRPVSGLNTVFYWPGGFTPGKNTIVHDVLESAGLHNIAAEVKMKRNGVLEMETLIMHQPDLLIFSDYRLNPSTLSHNYLKHPALEKAFPDVRTFILPSQALTCGSPATLEAAETLANYIENDLKNKFLSHN